MPTFNTLEYFKLLQFKVLLLLSHLVGVHHTPSMWVGTNAGQIFVYNITLAGEEDKEEGFKAEMGKEIKLRHKAPVVAIFVVDKEGLPLLGDLAEEDEKGWMSNCFFPA
jgi:lethal(2) giant larvae protein